MNMMRGIIPLSRQNSVGLRLSMDQVTKHVHNVLQHLTACEGKIKSTHMFPDDPSLLYPGMDKM